ncbi:hypothetical protein AX27061_5463 [Achromobacter xylosoxidans NBRC 15126 = ATCC 27061]|nr:hypothetical protein AX27061_5463 [Achromobacter xylosoxidans NBRC 15126 = ATCC 27061]
MSHGVLVMSYQGGENKPLYQTPFPRAMCHKMQAGARQAGRGGRRLRVDPDALAAS